MPKEDDLELMEVQENRKRLESAISKQQDLWGYSKMGLESKKAAMTMLATKHGMYANIPIICKAENCPYVRSCRLYDYDMAPQGEPCPVEVVQVENRVAEYTNDFGLTESSFVDNVIVNELIETDVMMERCKKIISERIVPLTKTLISVTEGREIYEEKVDPAIELNERLSKKRERLYNLMKATRKDQKDSGMSTISISDVIKEALDKEENGGFVIDVKPDQFKSEEEE